MRCCCGEAGADGGAELAGESPAAANPSIFTNCADLGMLGVECNGRADTLLLEALT